MPIFSDTHIGLVQLEIIDVAEFLEKNHTEIERILRRLRQEKALDYIAITCIDLEKAINMFFAPHLPTQKLLQHVLDVQFVDDIALRDGILMRKEIWPQLKEHLHSRHGE